MSIIWENMALELGLIFAKLNVCKPFQLGRGLLINYLISGSIIEVTIKSMQQHCAYLVAIPAEPSFRFQQHKENQKQKNKFIITDGDLHMSS